MSVTGLHYLDCNIRVRNRLKQREAPIFSGRIWFDSLDQFIMAVSKRLQPFVSTVDRTRIWYRKQGGRYHSIHSSEQEFLDVCSNTNILVSYFLHGPCPPPVIKSATIAEQKIDSLSENLISTILNLKDTFSTWSGSMQSWISLAQYYQAAGLKGTELVGIPKKYHSLFTIRQEKSVTSVGVNTSSIDGTSTNMSSSTITDTVSQSLSNDYTMLPKEKEKALDLSATALSLSVLETKIASDISAQSRSVEKAPPINYINNGQENNLYQQCLASQSMKPVAPLEESNTINNTTNLRADKASNQVDSLVHLTIPKVSAKAAYIITGIVYADIQERENK